GRAGARWMHVVDLDGAKEGRPIRTELIRRRVEKAGMKVQVGGGIGTREDIDALLKGGAARVVLGTAARAQGEGVGRLAWERELGGKVVLAIEAEDGVGATRGWAASSGRKAMDIAREVGEWKLGALLYTDVAKDGMMQGPNLEQTKLLAQAAGDVPVIASGGV